jgi:hypothetical protein
VFCLLPGLLLAACAASPSTAPPTVAPGDTPVAPPSETAIPNPTPTETQPLPASTTAPPGFAAIVETGNGFLLGGAQDGAWLEPAAAAGLLTGGERYRLYSGLDDLGEAVGEAPEAITDGPCNGKYVVGLSLQPGDAPALAVGGGWDVQPRTPVAFSTEAEVYQEAVAAMLLELGLPDADVRLTAVWQIDLEGDGADEVLISATRLPESAGVPSPPVAAGDYSIVMVRKVVGNNVVTFPLEMGVYPEAIDLAYPYRYTILGVLDLNGDGRLEVAVHGLRWEGSAVTVYEIEGASVERVLAASCAL